MSEKQLHITENLLHALQNLSYLHKFLFCGISVWQHSALVSLMLPAPSEIVLVFWHARKSKVLAWDRKSYLTQVISPW